MKKISNTFLLVFLISLLFSNCKKSEIERMNLTGSITGKVYVVSESDNIGFPESGIEVKIENTELSTVTDINGIYTVENIPSGTYNIVFSMDGYSEMKKCGVQITGGGNYPAELSRLFMREKSSTKASNLSVEYNNSDIIFSANFSPEAADTTSRGILLLISDNSNVSFDNNLDYYDPTINTGNEISFSINSDILSYWLPGFNPQKTYYAVAYGMSAGFGRYFDPEKGSNVFTGIDLTPTNTVSFTIPAE